MSIYNLFMYNYYQKAANQYQNNTIIIKEIPVNIHLLTFDIDYETKKQLFTVGIEAAQDFLKKSNIRDT